jgi:hypothetical protein
MALPGPINAANKLAEDGHVVGTKMNIGRSDLTRIKYEEPIDAIFHRKVADATRRRCRPPMSAVLSSLIEFVAAGVRPRTPLAKAIVPVLALKMIALVCMKLFLFPEQALIDTTERVIGVSALLG